MGDQSWIAMVGSSQDGYELRLYRQDQQIWGTALKFKEDDLKTLPVMTVNPYVDRPVIHIMTPETVLRFNLKGEPIHDQGNQ